MTRLGSVPTTIFFCLIIFKAIMEKCVGYKMCLFFSIIVENIPYSNKYLGNSLQDMHTNERKSSCAYVHYMY